MARRDFPRFPQNVYSPQIVTFELFFLVFRAALISLTVSRMPGIQLRRFDYKTQRQIGGMEAIVYSFEPTLDYATVPFCFPNVSQSLQGGAQHLFRARGSL